jgi:hypothetical protein
MFLLVLTGFFVYVVLRIYNRFHFLNKSKKKSYNFYSKILQLIQKNIKVDTSWLTLPNIVAT